MTKEEIASKSIAIVQEEFEELSNISLHPMDKIQDRLALSSLNVAILLTSLELEFDVNLSSQDLKNAETYQDLAAMIMERIKDA